MNSLRWWEAQYVIEQRFVTSLFTEKIDIGENLQLVCVTRKESFMPTT